MVIWGIILLAVITYIVVSTVSLFIRGSHKSIVIVRW